MSLALSPTCIWEILCSIIIPTFACKSWTNMSKQCYILGLSPMRNPVFHYHSYMNDGTCELDKWEQTTLHLIIVNCNIGHSFGMHIYTVTYEKPYMSNGTQMYSIFAHESWTKISKNATSWLLCWWTILTYEKPCIPLSSLHERWYSTLAHKSWTNKRKQLCWSTIVPIVQ